MAALTCEICGGKLIGKPGGIFECDSCGMEYDTAWAKAKIQEIKGTVQVEGTVEVTGKVQIDGPVKVEGGGPTVENLLKRGQYALIDGKWDNAREYFEQALDMDTECGEAYLGLAMAKLCISDKNRFWDEENLEKCRQDKDVQRAERFADDSLKQFFSQWDEKIKQTLADQAQAGPRLAARRKEISPAQGRIAIVDNCCVAVKADGTLLIAPDRSWDHYSPLYSAAKWTDITAISTYQGTHRGGIVGLRTDGTVMRGNAPIPELTDMASVAVSSSGVFGLKSDGTYIQEWTLGRDVEWKEIKGDYVDFTSGYRLKADGTVETEDSGEKKTFWEDIVSITRIGNDLVGLKADGTILLSEDCSWTAPGWRDIVAIVGGGSGRFPVLVGLKADGTVVTTFKEKQAIISRWRDVVAIAVGAYYNGDSKDGYHIVGLKADGTVVTTDEKAQKEMTGWKLFDSLETLEQDVQGLKSAAVERLRKKEVRRGELNSERSALNAEYAKLGLFSGKRKKEIEARLAEIDKELKTLS